jgi:hypothetical protein
MLRVSCFSVVQDANCGGFQKCTLAASLAALTLFSCAAAFNVQNANLVLKTRAPAPFLRQPLVLREKEDEIDEDRDNERTLAQRFVDSLMEAPIKEIPGSDGMKYLSGISSLETGVIRPYVVVRKMTNAFWDKCLQVVDTPGERYRVVAIGTPGIGKTTTTPLLIRKLLSTDNTVVYLMRSNDGSGWYYEFVSKNGKYTAEVYPESLFPKDIKSLRVRSTYFIVDPGDAKNTYSPAARLQPKLIIVASPDERHWGGRGFAKRKDDVKGFFKFLPLWSKEELIAAQPYIRPDMTKEQVMERYAMFGGSARNVFEPDDDGVETNLRQQTEAVKRLGVEQMRRIALGDVDDTAYFDKGAPSGLLMGFVLTENDNGKFEDFETVVMTISILQQMFERYKVDLWDTLVFSDARKRGYSFEYCVYFQLKNECKESFEIHKRGQNDSKATKGTMFHCTQLEAVENPVAAVLDPKAEPLVLYYSSKPNFELIDGVYKDALGKFHLIHATVAKQHTMNMKHVNKFQGLFGAGASITLYYFVPFFQFDEFKLTKAKGQTEELLAPPNWTVEFVSVPKPTRTESGSDEEEADSDE